LDNIHTFVKKSMFLS